MDPKQRLQEFPQLSDYVYLDNTGTTLFAKSQIDKFTSDLTSNLYGNPHTRCQSSELTTDTIDQVRSRILRYFHTSQDSHCIIFTSGSTGALKLLAEGFPWSPTKEASSPDEKNDRGVGGDQAGSIFCYLQDNHTSVVGMREVATANGARSVCLSPNQISSALSPDSITNHECNGLSDSNADHLFAYPGQSNFSGCKYPAKWTAMCKNGHLDKLLGCHGNWYVALDAASLVSTSPLDLSICEADFVPLSFYKMFGFPTGLGALIARKDALPILRKRYFGGGAVMAYSATQPFFVPRKLFHEWFEDGTPPFLDIIAVRHGLDTLECLAGGISSISEHTFYLAKYTFDNLKSLRHSNGKEVVEFYCKTDYTDINKQGPIICFNVLNPNGEYVGYAQFQKLAALYKIQLRTGCFCNIGACQLFLGLTDEEIQANYEAGHVCGDDIDIINGKPSGAVRISFGYMSLKADADVFLNFMRDNFVDFKLYKDIRKSTTHTERENSLDENQTGRQFTRAKLSQICLYPIKSCAAMKVPNWEIGPQGLMYDRQWMIVSEAGVFLSQKRVPRMCLIEPTIDLETGLLTISSQGMDPIHLPLDMEPNESSLEIKNVCADRCQTFDCGDAVSDWLTEVLGQTCRLHKQNANYARRRRTERIDVSGVSKLSLVNVDQYLLISATSTADFLQSLPGHDLETLMDRFRANFVISGPLEPFQEDGWRKLRIGSNVFEVTDLCMRCRMISVDQMTAGETRDTYKQLTNRRGRKATFGILLRRLEGESTGSDVSVEMEIEVLE
ncbi:molybdenum cofactor sulfurase-like [Apostichopus japonicus]|uniref:molybdenum cofactor sulfurase-like n=1 Tax=Stichopus japonicus TaxID=307972 RepID=UPI003AB5FBF9